MSKSTERSTADLAPEDDPRWLTMHEAAELADVTERAVRNWISRGKLQRYRRRNRYHVAIDRVELENFLAWRKAKYGQTVAEVADTPRD